MNKDLIGWISSGILVATLAAQVIKQYRQRSSHGVSKWLFIGEVAASSGFLAYSVMLGLRVYIVTNSIMILNSMLGLVITLYHRRSARS